MELLSEVFVSEVLASLSVVEERKVAAVGVGEEGKQGESRTSGSRR